VTGADRTTGSLDISRNGSVYAELAELAVPFQLAERFRHIFSAWQR
jgi:hypothetical protein